MKVTLTIEKESFTGTELNAIERIHIKAMLTFPTSKVAMTLDTEEPKA